MWIRGGSLAIGVASRWRAAFASGARCSRALARAVGKRPRGLIQH